MSYPDVTTVTEPFSATVLAIDLDATPQVDQFLEVAATTGWCEVDADGIANNVPLGQSGPFVVLVGSEQILCAKAQGSQLFVYLDEDVTGRGFGETSVVAHPNGTAVSLYATSVQSVATGGASATYANIAASVGTVPTPGTIGVVSFDLPFTADQSVGNYTVGGYTSVPQAASALGQVCGSFNCDIDGIDTTSDDYDIRMFVTISDLTGTNILTIDGTAQASAGGPNDSATVDWTTATATAVAGTDLVWDDTTTTVTSTAGGVYVVSVTCQCAWD